MNITLVPLDAHGVQEKEITLFLKCADYEVVAKISPFMFALVVVEENESGGKILATVQPLVKEFMDILPEEIPPR